MFFWGNQIFGIFIKECLYGEGTPAYSHGVTYRMESYINFGNVMGLLWVVNGQ